MTLDKSHRIVSAGTWIVIQDKLMNWAVYISILGLIGMVAAFLLGLSDFVLAIAAGTIVLSCTLATLSWGLEAFRMDGMPYEESIATWWEGRQE